MGYDFHITRASDWSQNATAKIAAEEWLAIVEADAELSLAPRNGPYFANWSGPSKLPEPWLDWFDGNVYTKAPDSALLQKMVRIATVLNAQVQGDEGEVYRGDEPLDETGRLGVERGRDRKGNSWWRRLTGG